MRKIMNVAYIVEENNRELLKGSIASLKANAADVNIKVFSAVPVDCMEEVIITDNPGVLAAADYFENETRVMVVSPFVYFARDPYDTYMSLDDMSVMAGAKHPLICIEELKNYVKNTLCISRRSFVSSQLLIINPAAFKEDGIQEICGGITDEEKVGYVNFEEDILNVLFTGRTEILSSDTLSVPGKNADDPVAVSFAYSGRPWEHAGSEFADLFRKYSDTSAKAKTPGIREIAGKYIEKSDRSVDVYTYGASYSWGQAQCVI